jgi:hypothetical protein
MEISGTPTVTELSAFLAQCPERLIYYAPSYLAFLQEAVGGEYTVLCVRNGEDILGIFPYFRKADAELGTVFNSLPWYGSHGACLVHPEADQEAVRRKLLVAFAAKLAAEARLLSATVSLSPFEEIHASLYHEKLKPQATDSRIGQVLHLPALSSEGWNARGMNNPLMTRMRQKARNCLYKGLRQGFTHQINDSNEAWDFLYSTHCENMAAIGGVPKQKEHLAALRRHIPSELRKLHLALLDGKTVAALLCFYYPPSVEYIMPVAKVEYRSEQPLSFLIHTAMIDAVQQGYNYWNFGGTWHTQKSLHRFKAGWGAADHPYSYFIMCSEWGMERIRQFGKELCSRFPNYYVYPFHLLEDK